MVNLGYALGNRRGGERHNKWIQGRWTQGNGVGEELQATAETVMRLWWDCWDFAETQTTYCWDVVTDKWGLFHLPSPIPLNFLLKWILDRITEWKADGGESQAGHRKNTAEMLGQTYGLKQNLSICILALSQYLQPMLLLLWRAFGKRWHVWV